VSLVLGHRRREQPATKAFWHFCKTKRHSPEPETHSAEPDSSKFNFDAGT